LGKEAFVDVINVVCVKTVVTPIVTRACVASRFKKKETQEITTILI